MEFLKGDKVGALGKTDANSIAVPWIASWTDTQVEGRQRTQTEHLRLGGAEETVWAEEAAMHQERPCIQS